MITLIIVKLIANNTPMIVIVFGNALFNPGIPCSSSKHTNAHKKKVEISDQPKKKQLYKCKNGRVANADTTSVTK